MKANEAPKKIILSADRETMELYDEWVVNDYTDNIKIEYVRADAIENLDERMIAKYLYEKKGYPIDLNGNIPSFEETMKDVEKYNNYKKDKLIEEAADKLKQLMYDQHLFEGRMHQDAIIENFVGYFKDYMKGE